jgi:hypothetical protein
VGDSDGRNPMHDNEISGKEEKIYDRAAPHQKTSEIGKLHG